MIGRYGHNGDPLPEIPISNSALLLYRGLSYCEKRMPSQKLSLGPNTLEQVPAEQRLDSRSQINSTSLEACREFVAKDLRPHAYRRVLDSAAMKREVPKYTCISNRTTGCSYLSVTGQSVCNYLGQFPTETQALFREWDILLLLYPGPDIFWDAWVA